MGKPGGSRGCVRAADAAAGSQSLAAAKAFPGGAYSAAFLLDGEENSEYASDGKGTNTFVEFDFGAPVIIGAFRHVDRHDLANVATSQLTFSDAAGHPLATVTVPHVGQSSGVTMFALPKPVTAQKVRWQVTKVVHKGIDCVGGREISFFRLARRSRRRTASSCRTNRAGRRAAGRPTRPAVAVALDILTPQPSTPRCAWRAKKPSRSD